MKQLPGYEAPTEEQMNFLRKHLSEEALKREGKISKLLAQWMIDAIKNEGWNGQISFTELLNATL